MINRTCENCKKNERIDHTICSWCLLSKDKVEFVPKEGLLNEESIRKDERNKVIELIETSPLIIIDDNDFNKRYYGNKAIEMYRERLICKLKKIKIMEE